MYVIYMILVYNLLGYNDRLSSLGKHFGIYVNFSVGKSVKVHIGLLEPRHNAQVCALLK